MKFKKVTPYQSICIQCGSQFTIRRNPSKGLCIKCVTSNAGKRSRQVASIAGDKNPKWKGGIFGDGVEWTKNWKKQYRLKNIEKYKASRSLNHEVKMGRIKKPNECEMCKSQAPLDGHHYLGYERENWLKVQWVCKTCHAKLHGKCGGIINGEE